MVDPTVPVVAIDGPGGSGKGTVARQVAAELGWHVLDSGALYRLVALWANRTGVALDDVPALAALAKALPVNFDSGPGGAERILLDGEDVTVALRTEECGRSASRIATQAPVRAALVGRQRAFRQAPGLVADGRDMGSVIFPDAGVKIFLTASAEERARRRHKQLKQQGIDVSLAALSKDISERDERDAARKVAPLRPGADARLLDSTELSIEEVARAVLRIAARVYAQKRGS